jgi:L-amino acid N-acyltransferase YncA
VLDEDEAHLGEHLEVVGDGGLADADLLDDLPDGHRRVVGGQLLGALVASAERGGIWTVQTGIFPGNQASVRLHRACGFRVVGVRERLGQLHGRWRDVLLLEHRSPLIT